MGMQLLETGIGIAVIRYVVKEFELPDEIFKISLR